MSSPGLCSTSTSSSSWPLVASSFRFLLWGPMSPSILACVSSNDMIFFILINNQTQVNTREIQTELRWANFRPLSVMEPNQAKFFGLRNSIAPNWVTILPFWPLHDSDCTSAITSCGKNESPFVWNWIPNQQPKYETFSRQEHVSFSCETYVSYKRTDFYLFLHIGETRFQVMHDCTIAYHFGPKRVPLGLVTVTHRWLYNIRGCL